VVYAYEGCGGSRDEDTDLVDGAIGAIEGAVFVERRGFEREEQSRRDALVDSVLGDVDKKEGQHTVMD